MSVRFIAFTAAVTVTAILTVTGALPSVMAAFLVATSVYCLTALTLTFLKGRDGAR